MDTENFHSDMDRLYSMLSNEYNLAETLHECFYNWRTDMFEYSEWMMFYFFYDVVNYDIISIYGKKIDIEASNEPEVAKLLKPYVTQKVIDMVHERIYERN